MVCLNHKNLEKIPLLNYTFLVTILKVSRHITEWGFKPANYVRYMFSAKWMIPRRKNLN